MSISPYINRITAFLCLGLALFILVIPLTEMNNIQVIALLGLYFALDPAYLVIRALFFLTAALSVTIIATHSSEAVVRATRFKQGMFTIVLGLLAGLIIFYGWTCCDNPVFFLLGFPFSWLRGTTPVFHYLPQPPMPYLLTNIFNIHWSIEAYSLAQIFFSGVISPK